MRFTITEEEKRHIMGLYECGVKQKISNTKNLLLEEGEPVSIINNGKKLYGTCTEGNCKDGFGRATFQNGSKYSGNWVNGNRTYGTFLDKEYGGKTYTGTWSNGLKNGNFTEVNMHGTKSFGKYVNNKEQGKWSYTYSNGSTSVNTYNNGELTYESDSDGYKLSRDAAGNWYRANPDGSKTYMDKDGNESKVNADGSKTYANKDGGKSEVDSDENKTYVNKDGTVYTVDKSGTNTQDQKCINKIKGPYSNAVTWWKNKLNEPAFYNKLKKLNNYTDQQTKEWINKYKTYLYNNISGPSCPKQGTTIYKESFKGTTSNAIAYLTDYLGDSMVVFNSKYLSDTNKDIEATFVHEIQHALYDLKPMTPDSNWKQVFPYKVWVNVETSKSKETSSQEKSTISKYGLKQNMIDWWKDALKRETDSKDPSNDVGYVCRITELASRVVTMKKFLGYSTEQKITVSDFKKFIEYKTVPYNDENAYFIVLCWVYNGMEDIQKFIDNLDKYVVAQAEPKKDDNIKDPTT